MPEWLSRRQVIIDAGTSLAQGTQQGDIYSKQIAKYVKAITPVPGGVGPVAVAELMRNVYKAEIKQMAVMRKEKLE